jgi:hypothetical protein
VIIVSPDDTGIAAARAKTDKLDARALALLLWRGAKARRGHGKAIVATARKLTVLFWCMLTREEDYAHQQPSLTQKKLRRLEITAGAPKCTPGARGIWCANDAIRDAERALAEQAETSYKRMVQDQRAGGPARRVGASVSLEHA